MNLTLVKLTGIFCFWLCACNLQAQQAFRFLQKQHVKVVIGTDTLKQPWVGGLNAPVFSKADLNLDGTEDLFVFDRMNNKSFTFLADNATGTWRWKYAPDFEALFPSGLMGWALLKDYNGDGQADLFTAIDMGGVTRVRVFKNESSQNNRLTFSNRPVMLGKNVFGEMEIGDHNLPAFEDRDNDGDLDMLSFEPFNAKRVEFYLNRRMEDALPPDSLRFSKSTGYWGRFERCTGCTDFSFNGSSCTNYKVMHGGSGSILALDLDADGDKDILIGKEDCGNLVKLTNSGSTATASITSTGINTHFPNNANPVALVNYPAAYYLDVTFDGKKDLLTSPFLANNLSTTQNFVNLNQSAWLYRNNAVSSAAAPDFSFVKNNFLQDEMLDFGEAAAPVFADIDADGDQDFLVGNFADFRTGAGQYRSAVSLFTNIGTATNPVFKLTNSDYLQLSQENYKSIKLQFGDMNGDGSLDLIIRYQDASGTQPRIDYIPNTAQLNQPYQFSKAHQVSVKIDLDAPADVLYFYDADADGDLDALLGTFAQVNNQGGPLWFYRRTSANPELYASWSLESRNYGNIPRTENFKDLQPLVADLDLDGQPDLVTTTRNGKVTVYPDFKRSPNNTFSAQSGIVFNQFLNSYQSPDFGRGLHVAAVDLNGDRKPDLVIGTNGGGLVYLENESTIAGLPAEKEALSFSIYPNPGSNLIQVQSKQQMEITIYNAAGELVYRDKAGTQAAHSVDVSGFRPGLYFVQAVAADGRSTGRKLLIQR